MKVLGIDHGSNMIGWGEVDTGEFIGTGRIDVSSIPFPEVLKDIYEQVGALLDEKEPEFVVLERQFIRKGVDFTGKMLVEVVGVIKLAAVYRKIEFIEIPANTVKRIITKNGRATKNQVKVAVQQRLGLVRKLKADEADALGLCVALPQYLAERREDFGKQQGHSGGSPEGIAGGIGSRRRSKVKIEGDRAVLSFD